MTTPIKPPTIEELDITEISDLFPRRPTAVVKLPSRGIYYDPEIVKDGQIEICPMSAREEKLVAGNPDLAEVTDVLLKRCLITKIDPADLIIPDRFYLLLMLRANSYGDDYTFKLTCPWCSTAANYTVQIPTSFEIRQPKTDQREPFTCKLPDSGATIDFRLLRGKDQADIRRLVEQDQRRGVKVDSGDPGFFYRLAKQIVAVNGKKTNILTATQVVERLSARDSTFFQDRYAKKLPGLIPLVRETCLACQRPIETEMPLTAEFFRPEYGGED